MRAVRARSARPRTRATPSTRRSTWCRSAAARARGENYEFFLDLPEVDRTERQGRRQGLAVPAAAVRVLRRLRRLRRDALRQAAHPALRRPHPHRQRDRLLEIYGGNLPTTPYAKDAAGRGPAWSNSLFEDNAEFGFGFRLAVDKQRNAPASSSKKLAEPIGDDSWTGLLDADQTTRRKSPRSASGSPGLKSARREDEDLTPNPAVIADYLVKKSVWIGAATGGPTTSATAASTTSWHRAATSTCWCSTPRCTPTPAARPPRPPRWGGGQVRRAGKPIAKKDLGLMAMSYGNVYVAQIAFGAKDNQTVRAFMEADSYAGPSLIIAYSHCIAHGYNLADGLDHQQMAVDSGFWPLYRFDPRRTMVGENPLKMDSKAPKMSFEQYAMTETRFRMLQKTDPERAKMLLANAQRAVQARFDIYQQLAGLSFGANAGDAN
jgi:pyruvate-ferredoxin/flavodoxin oxidoreductase